MHSVSLALLTLALAATPSSELAAAVADLRAQPAHLQPTTRYASFGNLSDTARQDTLIGFRFVLNGVSRASNVHRWEMLPGTTLLRWNLLDIAPRAEDLIEISAAYEALVADEPYWHLQTEVIDPRSGKKTRVFTDGGWTNLQHAGELRTLSGSAGALVRADWLITRLAAPPHYYRFAGVPESERELLRQLGIDPGTINQLRADQGTNLIQSLVTRKVRRIVRRQGPLGGAWHTYDVEQSSPERDPLRHPFEFIYDASEHIAVKPNGLHLYALYDSQGRRQDAVPDRIAKDDSDPMGDGIVRPMISCVRCHVESGLRTAGNDQQRIPLIGAADPETLDRLRQFYNPDKLEVLLRRDRQDYETALRLATGVSPPTAISALAKAFRAYSYALVTPEVAARELGVTAPLVKAFHGTSDPVLLLLAEGVSVQRLQWESSFAEAALLTWRP